jgi:putative transposase
MKEHRYGSHSVTRLTVQLVWVTKYRYQVLRGEVQARCRELIIQICDAEEVRILKGVVSKDHVHMHVEYPPAVSVSGLAKRLKGRTSRKLQQAFSQLEKRYWGRHFWAAGYGAWSTGNITEEMIHNYLEHSASRTSTSSTLGLLNSASTCSGVRFSMRLLASPTKSFAVLQCSPAMSIRAFMLGAVVRLVK